MLFSLELPKLGPYMDYGVIDKLYVAVNELVVANQKILDLRVDLSLTFAHDCPPVNYYRIVAGEQAYLRRLSIAAGDALDVGNTIALFSTGIDDLPAGTPQRRLIMSVIGIIPEETW
jgi:hypothetical protein